MSTEYGSDHFYMKMTFNKDDGMMVSITAAPVCEAVGPGDLCRRVR